MLCWSILLQISLFVVLSCHLVFRMYLGHLVMNVCSIRVALRVSEPYSSTLSKLVLKILILFRVEKDDVFHTVFKMLNVCLHLSNPVFYIFICLSFVCHYTSQIGECVVFLYIFSFQLYLSCFVPFTFNSFIFCMFVFKPVFSDSCVNLLDFVCICLCECDSRQMLSAKCRSSNCLVNVHWMPIWPCLTVSLIIKSITMITINGDRMHPCLTLVYTSNVSDSLSLWIIWQVEFSYICWISVINLAGIP